MNQKAKLGTRAAEAAAARAERLARELRANLKRRKSSGKAHDAAGEAHGGREPEGSE